MDPCCSNCRFSLFMGRVQRSVCRRFPPNDRVESHGRVSYHFPFVNEHDWCGEYRPESPKEEQLRLKNAALDDSELV